jgi:hypothetical protein
MYIVLLFFNHDVIRVEFTSQDHDLWTAFEVPKFILYTHSVSFQDKYRLDHIPPANMNNPLYAFSLNDICCLENVTKFCVSVFLSRFAMLYHQLLFYQKVERWATVHWVLVRSSDSSVVWKKRVDARPQANIGLGQIDWVLRYEVNTTLLKRLMELNFQDYKTW